MAHYAVGAVKVRPLRSRRGEVQYEMARFVLRKRLNRAAIALATGKGSKMGYFVLRKEKTPASIALAAGEGRIPACGRYPSGAPGGGLNPDSHGG